MADTRAAKTAAAPKARRYRERRQEAESRAQERGRGLTALSCIVMALLLIACGPRSGDRDRETARSIVAEHDTRDTALEACEEELDEGFFDSYCSDAVVEKFGEEEEPQLQTERPATEQRLARYMKLNFGDVSWYSLIKSYRVEDDRVTARTSLYPDAEAGEIGQTICGAVLLSDVLGKVEVSIRGQSFSTPASSYWEDGAPQYQVNL